MRRLLAELRYVPNQFTALRLVLVPVLWGLALAGQWFAVGVGLAVCFWSDFADGFAARRLGQTSAFGSDFDSKVDSLIGPSAIAWIVMYQPDAFVPERFLPGASAVDRFAYLPFGVGPRVCIGAHFALTEATLVLAELMRSFRIELVTSRSVLPVAVVTTQPDHAPLFRLRLR